MVSMKNSSHLRFFMFLEFFQNGKKMGPAFPHPTGCGRKNAETGTNQQQETRSLKLVREWILTRSLLGRGARVTSVEIDPRLCGELKKTLGIKGHLF